MTPIEPSPDQKPKGILQELMRIKGTLLWKISGILSVFFLAGMGFWEIVKKDDIERLNQQIAIQESESKNKIAKKELELTKLQQERDKLSKDADQVKRDLKVCNEVKDETLGAQRELEEQLEITRSKLRKDKALETTTVYNVDLTTGTAEHSGTNAPVSIQVIGKLGKITQKHLLNDKNRDDYQLGAVDDFNFEDIDVGDISAVRVFIGRNSKGRLNDWLLTAIQIRKGVSIWSWNGEYWFGDDESTTIDRTIPLSKQSAIIGFQSDSFISPLKPSVPDNQIISLFLPILCYCNISTYQDPLPHSSSGLVSRRIQNIDPLPHRSFSPYA